MKSEGLILLIIILPPVALAIIKLLALIQPIQP